MRRGAPAPPGARSCTPRVSDEQRSSAGPGYRPSTSRPVASSTTRRSGKAVHPLTSAATYCKQAPIASAPPPPERGVALRASAMSERSSAVPGSRPSTARPVASSATRRSEDRPGTGRCRGTAVRLLPRHRRAEGVAGSPRGRCRGIDVRPALARMCGSCGGGPSPAAPPCGRCRGTRRAQGAWWSPFRAPGDRFPRSSRLGCGGRGWGRRPGGAVGP
jgi:hypothetical protein